MMRKMDARNKIVLHSLIKTMSARLCLDEKDSTISLHLHMYE